jgi:hypothetical protein
LALVLIAQVPLLAAGQNRDQQTAIDMQEASREVIRTADQAADRFETDHLVLYIDKGLLSTEEEQRFAATVERGFAATAGYLQRAYDPAKGPTKPAYYLTNRAGISHAGPTTIFLLARRVIPAPAIAIHESVHLLLIRNAPGGRFREDLSPEEDARLTASYGPWLMEGLASFVSDEIASQVGLEPANLFHDGGNPTVDDEARRWLGEPRGVNVAPFVGSHGLPDNLLSDRRNVAAPYYVLSQSLIKYMVQRAGIATMVQLYEEHFDGALSIEEDVKRVTGTDLEEWRKDWLKAIAAPDAPAAAP